MKTYRVISSHLSWVFTADSPEEACFKAKQFASMQMFINKRSGPREWVSPATLKEIVRVFKGKFEVEEKV